MGPGRGRARGGAGPGGAGPAAGLGQPVPGAAQGPAGGALFPRALLGRPGLSPGPEG